MIGNLLDLLLHLDVLSNQAFSLALFLLQLAIDLQGQAIQIAQLFFGFLVVRVQRHLLKKLLLRLKRSLFKLVSELEDLLVSLINSSKRLVLLVVEPVLVLLDSLLQTV